MAFTNIKKKKKSSLSDRFPHGRLEDSVWEAAFCHSDTVAILFELFLEEQDFSWGFLSLEIC